MVGDYYFLYIGLIKSLLKPPTPQPPRKGPYEIVLVYTWAPKSLYRDRFKARVYTV